MIRKEYIIMSKFLNRLSRVMQRGHAFPIIVCLLVLIIALSSVYILFFTEKDLGTGNAATKVESETSDTRVIDDIYEGNREIPKFSVAPNTYDTNKFQLVNNQVTYPGAYVGIDVSDHQGVIDWAKVKESGINFAIIRVGYRGTTRGKLYIDDQFENNIKGATEAGLKVGVYYFSQATTVAEAEEEASEVLTSINSYQVDYPVIFDWEPVEDEGARTANISGDMVSDCAAAFCKKVSKAGYNAAVYINKTQAYEFYDLDKISSYDLWYAEYQLKPSLFYNFSIWQYSANGTLDGIDSPVDVNLSFKDYVKK